MPGLLAAIAAEAPEVNPEGDRPEGRASNPFCGTEAPGGGRPQVSRSGLSLAGRPTAWGTEPPMKPMGHVLARSPPLVHRGFPRRLGRS